MPDRIDRVYDVLVQECDAIDDESNRLQFRVFWDRDGDEYRFIGSLGFGGKFWRTRGEWFVNCYIEDETPERLAVIEKANQRLSVLRAAEVKLRESAAREVVECAREAVGIWKGADSPNAHADFDAAMDDLAQALERADARPL